MPAVTSDCSNPVTALEKAILTSKGPACVADGPLMTTVGGSRSACTENCVAARLPLPSVSWAAPAATSTVTVPLADGVMVAV